MITSGKTTTLAHCDDDDIFDIVHELEKSFGLSFARDAFRDVKTFGDLCTVFEQHLTAEHRDDCTSQQAFYRVRSAIVTTLPVDQNQVTPDSSLRTLFSKPGRRKRIHAFETCLGVKVSLLVYPNWLVPVSCFLFACSFIALLFSGKIAIAGFILLFVVNRLEKYYDSQFAMTTVRQLAEQLTIEHYTAARRFNHTVNRTEIRYIITQAFCKRFDMDKASLIPEATFGWA
ncbi:acyl carrier protein [Taibaiella helva]|uniref:hypothetical protein n=1 Tax=Taibaiella helva TaxID=2301235 RepID=UPI000E579E0F|nr:hypothetical protein [Taibaiella helva]